MNIGLVVTKEERFPMFYRVFDGNETNVTTVGRLIYIPPPPQKKEFANSDLLLIFARGRISEKNIRGLDGSDYDFICGLKKNRVVKSTLR